MTAGDALDGARLTEAISAAMIGLYAEFYGHARTTASTYINDNIVVCVLENILSSDETAQVDDGRAVRSSMGASRSKRAPRTSSPPRSSG